MKCNTLDVWKKSVALSIDVYCYFKTSKDYGFKDQITRSCLSIASNIAEGMEKESFKEKVRFLDISKGSAAEFQTQVIIGKGVGYIEDNKAKDWIAEVEYILSMLSKLQQYLKRNT